MSEVVYQKSKALTATPLTYCPGCTHGIIHKLVAEVMEELNIISNTIGIASVGCSVMSYLFFNCDMVQAAHGRACAVATGIKRTSPEQVVFTYQGDGDLASIGIAETIHAANRGENITVIFINNAIYGMTGGQMAPTTLAGMKTTTSPYGRNPDDIGYPIRMCELLASLVAPYYIERVSLLSPGDILRAKKAVNKAIQYNKEERGFTFIEFISTCPTNWGFDPDKAREWAKENMLPYYKLGVFRDKGEEVQ